MKKTGWLLALSLAAAPAAAQHDHGAGEKLGKVLFKTSCMPAAQKEFERALALLHSFAYPETLKAFGAVLEADANCAIAYWGLAMSVRPNPLGGPWDNETLKRGLDAVEKGEALGAKTRRERDWLAAARVLYKDYETVDQRARSSAYEQAMSALARKYPDDVEAKIFDALALNEVFDHKDMKPLQAAIKILQPLERRYPDHPGITHYLIHSYDFPAIAKKGIPYANRYAKIAPSAPHAQHMPSHIYSMVGMWKESIASNLAAVRVANEIAQRNKPDAPPVAFLHANDFMTYAYLQLGADTKARELVAETLKLGKMAGSNPGTQMGRVAIPARYALERQDWKGAAQLQPIGASFPPAEALAHFVRGLGAVRAGALVQAQEELDRLGEIKAGLQKTGQAYWAEQVEVQRLAVQAWLAHASGNRNQALKLMRGAADLEDSSTKHIAMENRIYPMRELLADLQREQGDPGAALTEYELSMRQAPNRLRGYYGAAKACEAIGQRKMAMTYWLLLAKLTQDADSDRAELAELKQALNKSQ